MPRRTALPPARVAATVLAALTLSTLAVAPSSAAGKAVAGEAPTTSAAAFGAGIHAPTTRAQAEGEDPLAVTIDTLSPAVLPAKGKVTITGTVTNADDETWTGVNIYPLFSPTPIASVADLDAETVGPTAPYDGQRVIEVVQHVETLAPGQTAPYALKVPRTLLESGYGLTTHSAVYWLGVHALGQSDTDSDPDSDGRARTFIPQVDVASVAAPIDLAMVLQLRRRVAHTAVGRVASSDNWGSEIASGGQLRSIVDFGAYTADRPVTWLVDPAVPDAVRRLMAGNAERMPPPPDPEEEPTEEPSAEPSAEPSGGTPSPSLVDGEAAGDRALAGGIVRADQTEPIEPDPQPVDPAQLPANAEAWLTRLNQAVAGKQVLALPYGDVDASAASDGYKQFLRDAQQAGTQAMAELGITTTPAIGSPNGFLAPKAIDAAVDGSTVIVSDRSISETGIVDVGRPGRRIVVSSATAVAGGPGPDDPTATVAMRQRLLSEAALRLLSGDQRPLVAVLPKTWSPDDPSVFFAGLDQAVEDGWLNLATLDGVDQTPDAAVPADQISYPEHQQDLQLDAEVLDAAVELGAAGRLLQTVIPPETGVGTAITRESYAVTAYGNRTQPDVARTAATGSEAWVNQTLGRIQLTTLRSVTLTSDSGRFPLTIYNRLDVPVTVSVRARPGADLEVELPGPVTVNPGERFPLRPVAKTERIGAHNLTLTLTNNAGEPIGRPIALPVRSNQVSRIIWLIMFGGGVILFGVGGSRLLRRQRSKREANPIVDGPEDAEGPQ